jgi:hypothetical protein
VSLNATTAGVSCLALYDCNSGSNHGIVVWLLIITQEAQLSHALLGGLKDGLSVGRQVSELTIQMQERKDGE